MLEVNDYAYLKPIEGFISSPSGILIPIISSFLKLNNFVFEHLVRCVCFWLDMRWVYRSVATSDASSSSYMTVKTMKNSMIVLRAVKINFIIKIKTKNLQIDSSLIIQILLLMLRIEVKVVLLYIMTLTTLILRSKTYFGIP